ncbi:MAG: anti-sigma factor antagonist [Lachnospiraceae bacterium]|nr:anti-sigma factor antagonist [Candidatus Darwinimomas equi]
MNSKLENEVLTIYPEGRIDTNNANEIQAEINNIISENKYNELVLDLDRLNYLSSAGLRVVLKLRKDNKNMKIVEVVPEVYEVFETTGFTEMMPIEKGYRRYYSDGWEKIGEGANGVVYRMDPETIVKCFKNSDALPEIERERKLAREAFVHGVPTAIPYDVVKVGESYGTVYELLNAKSLAKILAEDSSEENIDKCVKIFVELLKQIHSTEVYADFIPSQNEIGIAWVEFLKEYLPEDTWNKLYGLVTSLPECNTMLHGDYHVKNVMVQDDEALLIDMDTIACGSIIYEFGSMYNAFKGFAETDPGQTETFLGITNEVSSKFFDKTVALYFSGDYGDAIKKKKEKMRLIGIVRLMRRSIRRKALESDEGRKLIDYYRNVIVELTDKVDNLNL